MVDWKITGLDGTSSEEEGGKNGKIVWNEKCEFSIKKELMYRRDICKNPEGYTWNKTYYYYYYYCWIIFYFYIFLKKYKNFKILYTKPKLIKIVFTGNFFFGFFASQDPNMR